MKLILALLAFWSVIDVRGGAPSEPPPVDSLAAGFTARPIQDDTTCVAPCAVHFDAIGLGALSAVPYVTAETTDNIYDNEFHTLQFVWDFGDYNDSGGRYWPNSGQLKNFAIGGLAGHTYYDPGTYTIKLTVTNPAGIIDTVTHNVTVADPEVAFSDALTYCVAQTADGDWNGCPLDCTVDDNCVVTANLVQALNGADGCTGGTQDCADIDTRKVRVYFRRGDTFTATSGITFFSSAGPGLISAFGTGNKPIFVTNVHLEPRQGWTLANITHNTGAGAEAILINNGVNRVSLIDFRENETANACITSSFVAPTGEIPQLFALINFECNYTAATPTTVMWTRAQYFMQMGGFVDQHGTAVSTTGNHYAQRAYSQQHAIMQHTLWQGGGSTGQNWQWRSWDDLPGGSDDEDQSAWVLVSDNINIEPNNNGADRVCDDSGCNCISGGTGCFPGNGGKFERVHDFIFERNYWARSSQYTPAAAPFNVIELSGGRHSLRNNIIDFQGGISAVGTITFVRAVGYSTVVGSTPPTNPIDGQVWVTNNTVFWDDSVTDNFNMLAGGGVSGASGCPGCGAYNNLVVTPNDAVGTLTATSGTGTFSSSANVRSTSEAIFAAAVPEQGTARIKDYRLRSTDTIALDQGFDYTSETSHWTAQDARGFCRPTGSGWDIGATEFNGARCGYASGRNFYYISSVYGNDSTGTGTLDRPWATLTTAAATANASDYILYLEGGYNEAIDSTGSQNFTSGSTWPTRLVISSNPNDSVTIQPMTGLHTVYFAESGASYIEVAGMNINGDSISNDTIKITCTGATCNTDGTNAASHIRLRNLVVHGSNQQGVLIAGIGSTFNQIWDNEFYDAGDTVNQDHCMYISTDDNSILRNLTHSCASAGIQIYSGATGDDPDRNVVSYNESYSNGTAGPEGPGIESCGANNVITFNVSHANTVGAGVAVFDDNDGSDGTICNSIDTTVQYNWLYGNNAVDGNLQIFSGTVNTVSTPNVFFPP